MAIFNFLYDEYRIEKHSRWDNRYKLYTRFFDLMNIDLMYLLFSKSFRTFLKIGVKHHIDFTTFFTFECCIVGKDLFDFSSFVGVYNK